MTVENLILARPEPALPLPDETFVHPLQDARRLAATYEAAGVGIVEIDAEGRLLRVNKQVCQMLGRTEPEMLGQNLFDLTHPDDAITDQAQYRRQVAGEIDGYTLEKRFVHKDGGVLWANVTSRSVRETDGTFLYAVRVQQDITARKQAEMRLTRYAQQQAALHNLTADLQQAASLDHVYRAAMDAAARALGCSRASVLLFDHARVMRFVAWRNLSEGYRNAVDGHSPWSSETRNPLPVCIDDVSRSDLPEHLKKVVLDEGIKALAFVPLQDGSRLLGKFMLYYDGHARVHARRDRHGAHHRLACRLQRRAHDGAALGAASRGNRRDPPRTRSSARI